MNTTWWLGLICTCLALPALGGAAPGAPDWEVTDLEMTGAIEAENVAFQMALEVVVHRRPATLTLVDGDAACLDATLPAGARLARNGRQLQVTLRNRGAQKITLKFASLPARDGDWRETRFSIPGAAVRRLRMLGDRADLDMQLPGALDVERGATPAGRPEVVAYLGVDRPFVARWKPAVRKLDADLVVACDANTIATARGGALTLDTLLDYQVVQGSLDQVSLLVPTNVSITQVTGADLRDWHLAPQAEGPDRLVVRLSVPRTQHYQLQVLADMVLPRFPCRFDLPVLRPLDVIRASGFLKCGTDSAIKLVAARAVGLTQVDQAAFPTVTPAGQPAARPTPARSALAYQYAGLPYTLELQADDMVTTYHAEDQMVLAIKDGDLALDATVELDVREAPAREIVVETDPGWTVAQVTGRDLADYDVRDEGGRRIMAVYFRDAVMGRTLLKFRLEQSLAPGAPGFSAPAWRVRGARSERGYLALRAEPGVQVKAHATAGLREVPAGSLPLQVPDLQQAFRFKTPDWTLDAGLAVTPPTIYCEALQLVTLGDGALYGSCALTYHVGGAPVQALRLNIPAECQNVAFAGRDVRGPTRQGTVWTVALQEKISGDYTLLVTYDRPFDEQQGDLLAGGIEPLGTEYSAGYMVVAGAASFHVAREISADPGLIPITAAELPEAYALLVNAPVIRAYQYVRAPHAARLQVRRYPLQPLLTQVADYTTLSTRLSAEGETVTEAAYFVKNSSAQYLAITLPDNARLWSSTVDGQPAQALHAAESRQLLVPLPRHRDPNQVAQVGLTYGETHPRPGWIQTVTLRAPLAAAQSVFAKWQVRLPPGHTVGRARGNMMADQPPPAAGLTGLVTGIGGYYKAALRVAPRMLPLLVLAALGAGLAAYCQAGRVRRWPRLFLFGLLAILAAGWVMAPWPWLLRARAPRPPCPSAEAGVAFTKVVSLADTAPELILRVVPDWVGAGGAPWRCAAGLALALAGAAWRPARRKAPGLAWAAVLVLATWALAQLAATRIILGIGLAVAAPLGLAVLLFQAGRHAGRRRALRVAARTEPPPWTARPAAAGTPGFTRPGLCVALALTSWGLALAYAPLAAPVAEDVPAPAPTTNRAAEIVMDNVEIIIAGPVVSQDEDPIARVTQRQSFTSEKPCRLAVLPAGCILTGFQLNSRDLALSSHPDGYDLDVAEAGTYDIRLVYLVPVTVRDHVSHLPLYLPPNLRNQARLSLPAPGLAVSSPTAVMLTTTSTVAGTESRLVFGPAEQAAIQWQPQARPASDDPAVYFCEVNTLADFAAGAVALTHQVHYQIAQGELQHFTLDIPENMSVTAVRGEALSTWRFDPLAHRLEAWRERPAQGDYLLAVVAQVSRDGLPYSVNLGMPLVVGAARQIGAMAAAAPDDVQLQIESYTGMSPMNSGDFSARAATADAASPPPAIRRCFRYNSLPAVMAVRAERVLPELRVTEDDRLDVSDERVVLAARLVVNVAKAGIFALRLQLPEGYEIDSLGGPAVSHWDEIRETGRVAIVNFTRQIMGDQPINLVLTRTGRAPDAVLEAPRVSVATAVKVTGTLVVSAEHGLRLVTVGRDGVSEINPRELGLDPAGTLAYRLLRPDWRVAMQPDVVAPTVKVAMLQRVALSEGLLQGQCFIRYQVDGAGVKSLLLQAPRPGVALAVAGRDIAQVKETDRDKGLWTVELRNKVAGPYRLEVSYQVPFDPDQRRVAIEPLRAPGTDDQGGYLAVIAGSRVQVRATRVDEALRAADARAIPAEFGAGDLADAILCYRVARPAYQLEAEILRHESAAALPATIRSARLTTVVAGDGQAVTRAVLDLQVRDLRRVPVRLPPAAHLWCARVNGRPVQPMRQGPDCLLPLETATPGAAIAIELIYGDRAQRHGDRHEFSGPQFDLPLADVAWTFYLPPRFRYHDFGGTLEVQPELRQLPDGAVYDTRRYTEELGDRDRSQVQLAEQALEQGHRLARAGQPRAARAAFEDALFNSQGRQDLNEDARIQYRNLARQQVVAGLLDRRANLKLARNGADRAPTPPRAADLAGEDPVALDILADTLIDQQAAAAASVPAIQVALPLQGRRIDFHRALQIQPQAPMTVTFKATAGGGWWMETLALLALAGGGLAATRRLAGI